MSALDYIEALEKDLDAFQISPQRTSVPLGVWGCCKPPQQVKGRSLAEEQGAEPPKGPEILISGSIKWLRMPTLSNFQLQSTDLLLCCVKRKL